MIKNFKHRGLKRLYEKDDPRQLQRNHVDKISRILARLVEAPEVAHMDVPGFRLHPLSGDLRGFWSVAVRSNWRVIFRFDGSHAFDVDLVDYH